MALLFALVAASCIESESVLCGDLVCPSSYTCIDDSYCAAPSQISACAGLADGASCSYTGVTTGLCDRGACFATGCGNGILAEGERCDDGNTTGGDGCSADCLSDETCGNGVLDRRTEDCDCGMPGAVAADCAGPNSLEPGACRPNCERPRCGDEILDPDEHCEPSMLSATCDSIGLYGGTLACSPVCQYDLSGCGRCGDGIVNGPELCDGNAPAGTCLDFGFDFGRLSCSPACTPGVSSCRKIGWPTVPSPTANNLMDAWGSSASDVFAVGANGTIVHYDGSAWTAMSSGTTRNLTSVWGTGPADVYAVGSDNGTVLHWNGTSWTSLNIGTTAVGFTSVWAGGGEVFALTNDSRVYHRDGAGWTPMTLPNQELQFGIWGSSPDDVWVVGPGGVARYNGSMWSDVSQMQTEFLTDLRSIWGRAPNDVFVSAGGGTIYHHDGTGWSTSLSLGLGGGELSPSFDLAGVVGTSDVFASISPSSGTVTTYHYDGDTWTPMRGEPGVMWASGPADVWAVYAAGSIRRFTGLAWMPVEPASNVQAVWSSGRRAASAAISGCVFDGKWRNCQVGPFNDVDGTSFGHVIAVGAAAAKRWNGTAWSDVTGLDPSTADYFSVSVTSASSMFVGANAGRILEWNGATWMTHQLSSTASASDVWSAGPGDAWAILGSTPYRLANGSWTPHPTATGVGTLWGESSTDIRAVGPSGIYHWTGSAWQAEPTPPASLLGIGGSSPTDMFAVGFGGAILHNDGAGWLPVRSPTTGLIRHVAVSPEAVFFAGTSGASGLGEVFGLLRVAP